MEKIRRKCNRILSNKPERLTLRYCQYKDATQGKLDLIKNMKIHENGKMCNDFCDFKSYIERLLAAHVCAQFGSEDDVKNNTDSTSSECNEKESKSNLNSRVLSAQVPNEANPDVTCEICKSGFKCKKSMDDHILKSHPTNIESVTSKIHDCKICYFRTTIKHRLDTHMLRHPEANYASKVHSCRVCGIVFKSKISMDDHIVKHHAEYVDSVTSKIHECKVCLYRTTFKHCFDAHMLKHPELNSTFKFHTCMICNSLFKNRISMDDHIVKHHTESMDLVTSKIHECKTCLYKTTYKDRFETHMLRHPEADPSKFSVCIVCNATFRSKQKMDDHVLKQHPDFVESVTSKIHKCKVCLYKTTFKDKLSNHMSTHPKASTTCQPTCMHCNKSFSSRVAKDDHILKKHPRCIDSVTSKMHVCKLCTFKTTFKHNLDRHMLKQHRVAKSSC
nr:unnamed protein product [Callosobruchus analis]